MRGASNRGSLTTATGTRSVCRTSGLVYVALPESTATKDCLPGAQGAACPRCLSNYAPW